MSMHDRHLAVIFSKSNGDAERNKLILLAKVDELIQIPLEYLLLGARFPYALPYHKVAELRVVADILT